ncbi:MAG TPA: FAD-binding oxidoreductase [Myxococcaceae bacterium]
MKRIASLDLDDNTSVWADVARPAEPLPPLQGDVTADVAIIGAGFTGVSTAYHLARRFPGRRVVVLEAKRIGNGASGRNGGMALNWINGVVTHSAERARRVFSVTRGGLDWIEQVIREHSLGVRFDRIGCLEAYTDARRAEEAHQRAETLASFGLPIRYLAGEELRRLVRAEGFAGAVLDPTSGQLNGLDFLRALAPVVRGLGVEIYEQTPVVRVEEGRTHVLTTPGGTVRAAAMVVATNGYSGRLGYFRTGVCPLHSHVIATEPLPPERWAELGWSGSAGFTDDLDRIAYASMTPDGRLVFGGGGNGAYSYRWGSRTSWPAGPAAQHEYVRGVLTRYFPGVRDVRITHRWTGTLGMTLSRVCAMGVTGEHRNVLYALGYSGHGVVLANLAGQVLCDLYSDHHEPWRDLPFYHAVPGGIPGEPLRWLGYQAYTRFTGRSPRRHEAPI